MAFKYFGKLVGTTISSVAALSDTSPPNRKTPFNPQAPATKFFAYGEPATSRSFNRVAAALSGNVDYIAGILDTPTTRVQVLPPWRSFNVGGGEISYSGFPGLVLGDPGVATATTSPALNTDPANAALATLEIDLAKPDTTTGVYPPAVWIFVGTDPRDLHRGLVAQVVREDDTHSNVGTAGGSSSRIPSPEYSFYLNPRYIRTTAAASAYHPLPGGFSTTALDSSADNPPELMPEAIAPIQAVDTALPPYDAWNGQNLVEAYETDGINIRTAGGYDWDKQFARPGCYVHITSGAYQGLYLLRSFQGAKGVLTRGGLSKVDVTDGTKFSPGQLVSWSRDQYSTEGLSLNARGNKAYVVFRDGNTVYLSNFSGPEDRSTATNTGSLLGTKISAANPQPYRTSSVNDLGLVDKEAGIGNVGWLMPVGTRLYYNSSDTNSDAVTGVTGPSEPTVFDPKTSGGAVAVLCSPSGFLLNPRLGFTKDASFSYTPGKYSLVAKTLSTVREKLSSSGARIGMGAQESSPDFLSVGKYDPNVAKLENLSRAIKTGYERISPSSLEILRAFGGTSNVLGPDGYLLKFSPVVPNITVGSIIALRHPTAGAVDGGKYTVSPLAIATVAAIWQAGTSTYMLVRGVVRQFSNRAQSDFRGFPSFVAGNSAIDASVYKSGGVDYVVTSVTAPTLLTREGLALPTLVEPGALNLDAVFRGTFSAAPEGRDRPDLHGGIHLYTRGISNFNYLESIKLWGADKYHGFAKAAIEHFGVWGSVNSEFLNTWQEPGSGHFIFRSLVKDSSSESTQAAHLAVKDAPNVQLTGTVQAAQATSVLIGTGTKFSEELPRASVLLIGSKKYNILSVNGDDVATFTPTLGAAESIAAGTNAYVLVGGGQLEIHSEALQLDMGLTPVSETQAGAGGEVAANNALNTKGPVSSFRWDHGELGVASQKDQMVLESLGNKYVHRSKIRWNTLQEKGTIGFSSTWDSIFLQDFSDVSPGDPDSDYYVNPGFPGKSRASVGFKLRSEEFLVTGELTFTTGSSTVTGTGTDFYAELMDSLELDGRITTTAGSSTVTGSTSPISLEPTIFTKQLSLGDIVTDGTNYRTVASVTNDQTFVMFGVESVGFFKKACKKIFNAKDTLVVDGTSVTVGSITTATSLSLSSPWVGTTKTVRVTRKRPRGVLTLGDELSTKLLDGVPFSSSDIVVHSAGTSTTVEAPKDVPDNLQFKSILGALSGATTASTDSAGIAHATTSNSVLYGGEVTRFHKTGPLKSVTIDPNDSDVVIAESGTNLVSVENVGVAISTIRKSRMSNISEIRPAAAADFSVKPDATPDEDDYTLVRFASTEQSVYEGTLTVAANNITVTGVGTKFLSDLSDGNYLNLYSDAGGNNVINGPGGDPVVIRVFGTPSSDTEFTYSSNTDVANAHAGAYYKQEGGHSVSNKSASTWKPVHISATGRLWTVRECGSAISVPNVLTSANGLTGSGVSGAINGTTVTGVNTSFTTDFSVGDFIWYGETTTGRPYEIVSITNDLTMGVYPALHDEPAVGTYFAGVSKVGSNSRVSAEVLDAADIANIGIPDADLNTRKKLVLDNTTVAGMSKFFATVSQAGFVVRLDNAAGTSEEHVVRRVLNDSTIYLETEVTLANPTDLTIRLTLDGGRFHTRYVSTIASTLSKDTVVLSFIDPWINGAMISSGPRLLTSSTTSDGQLLEPICLIETSAAHNLSAFEFATISGSDSVASIDGTYLPWMLLSTMFKITSQMSGNHAISLKVPVTVAGTTGLVGENKTTINFATDHGLIAGESFTLSGTNTTPTLDGTHTVSDVVDSDSVKIDGVFTAPGGGIVGGVVSEHGLVTGNKVTVYVANTVPPLAETFSVVKLSDTTFSFSKTLISAPGNSPLGALFSTPPAVQVAAGAYIYDGVKYELPSATINLERTEDYAKSYIFANPLTGEYLHRPNLEDWPVGTSAIMGPEQTTISYGPYTYTTESGESVTEYKLRDAIPLAALKLANVNTNDDFIALSGTVSGTAGTNSIQGTGTSFTTELVVGDGLDLHLGAQVNLHVVMNIISDVSLEVLPVLGVNSPPGTIARKYTGFSLDYLYSLTDIRYQSASVDRKTNITVGSPPTNQIDSSVDDQVAAYLQSSTHFSTLYKAFRAIEQWKKLDPSLFSDRHWNIQIVGQTYEQRPLRIPTDGITIEGSLGDNDRMIDQSIMKTNDSHGILFDRSYHPASALWGGSPATDILDYDAHFDSARIINEGLQYSSLLEASPEFLMNASAGGVGGFLTVGTVPLIDINGKSNVIIKNVAFSFIGKPTLGATTSQLGGGHHKTAIFGADVVGESDAPTWSPEKLNQGGTPLSVDDENVPHYKDSTAAGFLKGHITDVCNVTIENCHLVKGVIGGFFTSQSRSKGSVFRPNPSADDDYFGSAMPATENYTKPMGYVGYGLRIKDCSALTSQVGIKLVGKTHARQNFISPKRHTNIFIEGCSFKRRSYGGQWSFNASDLPGNYGDQILDGYRFHDVQLTENSCVYLESTDHAIVRGLYVGPTLHSTNALFDDSTSQTPGTNVDDFTADYQATNTEAYEIGVWLNNCNDSKVTDCYIDYVGHNPAYSKYMPLGFTGHRGAIQVLFGSRNTVSGNSIKRTHVVPPTTYNKDLWPSSTVYNLHGVFMSCVDGVISNNYIGMDRNTGTDAFDPLLSILDMEYDANDADTYPQAHIHGCGIVVGESPNWAGYGKTHLFDEFMEPAAPNSFTLSIDKGIPNTRLPLAKNIVVSNNTIRNVGRHGIVMGRDGSLGLAGTTVVSGTLPATEFTLACAPYHPSLAVYDYYAANPQLIKFYVGNRPGSGANVDDYIGGGDGSRRTDRRDFKILGNTIVQCGLLESPKGGHDYSPGGSVGNGYCGVGILSGGGYLGTAISNNYIVPSHIAIPTSGQFANGIRTSPALAGIFCTEFVADASKSAVSGVINNNTIVSRTGNYGKASIHLVGMDGFTVSGNTLTSSDDLYDTRTGSGKITLDDCRNMSITGNSLSNGAIVIGGKHHDAHTYYPFSRLMMTSQDFVSAKDYRDVTFLGGTYARCNHISISSNTIFKDDSTSVSFSLIVSSNAEQDDHDAWVKGTMPWYGLVIGDESSGISVIGNTFSKAPMLIRGNNHVISNNITGGGNINIAANLSDCIISNNNLLAGYGSSYEDYGEWYGSTVRPTLASVNGNIHIVPHSASSVGNFRSGDIGTAGIVGTQSSRPYRNTITGNKTLDPICVTRGRGANTLMPTSWRHHDSLISFGHSPLYPERGIFAVGKTRWRKASSVNADDFRDSLGNFNIVKDNTPLERSVGAKDATKLWFPMSASKTSTFNYLPDSIAGLHLVKAIWPKDVNKGESSFEVWGQADPNLKAGMDAGHSQAGVLAGIVSGTTNDTKPPTIETVYEGAAGGATTEVIDAWPINDLLPGKDWSYGEADTGGVTQHPVHTVYDSPPSSDTSFHTTPAPTVECLKLYIGKNGKPSQGLRSESGGLWKTAYGWLPVEIPRKYIEEGYQINHGTVYYATRQFFNAFSYADATDLSGDTDITVANDAVRTSVIYGSATNGWVHLDPANNFATRANFGCRTDFAFQAIKVQTKPAGYSVGVTKLTEREQLSQRWHATHYRSQYNTAVNTAFETNTDHLRDKQTWNPTNTPEGYNRPSHLRQTQRWTPLYIGDATAVKSTGILTSVAATWSPQGAAVGVPQALDFLDSSRESEQEGNGINTNGFYRVRLGPKPNILGTYDTDPGGRTLYSKIYRVDLTNTSTSEIKLVNLDGTALADGLKLAGNETVGVYVLQGNAPIKGRYSSYNNTNMVLKLNPERANKVLDLLYSFDHDSTNSAGYLTNPITDWSGAYTGAEAHGLIDAKIFGGYAENSLGVCNNGSMSTRQVVANDALKGSWRLPEDWPDSSLGRGVTSKVFCRNISLVDLEDFTFRIFMEFSLWNGNGTGANVLQAGGTNNTAGNYADPYEYYQWFSGDMAILGVELVLIPPGHVAYKVVEPYIADEGATQGLHGNITPADASLMGSTIEGYPGSYVQDLGYDEDPDD